VKSKGLGSKVFVGREGEIRSAHRILVEKSFEICPLELLTEMGK
jgi:hypothetical protein